MPPMRFARCCRFSGSAGLRALRVASRASLAHALARRRPGRPAPDCLPPRLPTGNGHLNEHTRSYAEAKWPVPSEPILHGGAAGAGSPLRHSCSPQAPDVRGQRDHSPGGTETPAGLGPARPQSSPFPAPTSARGPGRTACGLAGSRRGWPGFVASFGSRSGPLPASLP